MKEKAIKAFLKLILVFGLNNSITAQTFQYGFPGIRNFSHSEYGGANQSWSFTETRNGLLYFANNHGLLEFDGAHWAIYNSVESNNRTVLADGNRIYIGAFSEFGYYEENEKGNLIFHSLTHLVRGLKGDLGEIWRIHKTDFGIIFESYKALFIYRDGKIEVVSPHSSFRFSSYVNGILWIFDEEQGLMEYRAGKVRKVPGGDFFTGNQKWSVLPLNDYEIVIGTSNKGVFRFDGYKVIPWNSEINESLKKYQIYTAIRLKNNYFAFGTIQNGLYVTDSAGNLVFAMNKERGLQNNTVLGLGQDSKGNIWLCLDNGISMIEFETPISYIDNYFDLGTGYVSARFGDKIYFGTNQGLYYANWIDFRNPSKSKSSFKLVEGTVGQVWALSVIDNVLFCGHNNGIYQIQGNTSEKISSIPGAWNFLKLNDKGVILVGTYKGLLILEKKGRLWQVKNKIEGFAESSRFVQRDQSGNIWISHSYKGVFRLKPDSSLNNAIDIKLFTAKNGLPSDKSNFLFQIQKELLIATCKGIYKFNDANERFEKELKFLPYLKDNQQIDFLYQDSLKNLWYCADKKLGVLRVQKDGSYRNFVSLFSKVSNFLVPTYLHVNELDLNDVLIGIEGGYVHYVSKFNKDYMLPASVFISELKSRDTSEGIYRYNSSTKVQSVIPAFKYRNNTISIAFSTNNFESPGKDFQYKLIGFDKDWSEWTAQTFKEYTNLPAGEYTFALNARNNDQMQPSRLSYKFKILPPWYLTWYAWILYAILFIISLFLVQRYFKYRMEKSRLAENQKQKEKALLAEKEMEHLRNEKLNLEVIHKEKELANSTMQLIHKNKILNKLKTDLLNSVSSHGEVVPKTNVNSLIKRIDKEIDNEKQWQVFDMHVEQVYENLFKNLKDQYPDLTPRELSLCAYLRMNISSKEIAALMNISPRGVEISRYRIRKKLKLDHDANLTEFIMKF
jgi:ligand-binding sensor domain-containing protein/DNA-binding CsgD family transcriptional regulator